jgi:peptidoglycan pentaglycine glycine transferase (the first glycine)
MDLNQTWNSFINIHPEAHLLQTGAWGALKADFGWFSVPVQADGCGAQVLFRRLPLGFTFAYIPKGPVGAGWQSLWPLVDQVCRQQRAIFVKVEPDGWDFEIPRISTELPGFIQSAPVQPRRTLLIDLHGSEEDWLGRMKQKTRYNIHLAERKGVVVHPSNDLDVFQRLMQTTGQRDGFGIHSQAYYHRAFELFAADGHCTMLVAEADGSLLAALMVFAWGCRSWYFYGASSDEGRNLMPTYLLQWQAMRWAASRGCLEYDLWGVPDVDEQDLEDHFAERSDGLWGVYRFKRGFGGHMARTAGAWDRVYQPLLYKVYQVWLARRGAEGG